MSVEIVQYPWSQWYNKCYVYINKATKRKCIELRNSNKRYNTSYARYLMAIKLGHLVPEELDVDHIDNDCTNDDINNLQLLTREENLEKYRSHQLAFMQETISLVNEYALQGMYPAEISRLLKIDRSTVKKYIYGSIPNGRREANRKLIKPAVIDKINKYAQEGKSCHQISKLLNISDSVVKKYAAAPLANGRKEAHPYILKQEVIDQINSFDPNINNDAIARLLKIDHTTVKKYRTTKYKDGRKPSAIVKKISKIPIELIDKINSPEYVGISSKSLAKKLNIDRSCIERYRHIDSLDSEILFKLIEIINYRKRQLTLKQIRDKMLIGKNTMSKYAYYINRDDVQEQLEGYQIKQYSQHETLSNKEHIDDNRPYVTNDDHFDEKVFAAYNNFQINALKAFQEANGDYTDYITIETSADDHFLVVSGTRWCG